MKRYAICITTTCLTLAVAMLSYDGWTKWSIGRQFVPGDITMANADTSWTTTKTVTMPNFALRNASVALGNCSPTHFWGNLVYYREDDTVLPHENYVHVGRACRDWANGRWILVADVPFGWSRYWK